MLMFHGLFIHHIFRGDDGLIKIALYKTKEDVKCWTEKGANLFQIKTDPSEYGGDELKAIKSALEEIRKETKSQ